MPAELTEVIYTAEAVAEGGREGRGRTRDGRLDVDLSVGDDGPGTNPEQLFAVGYAACFQSALLGVARGRNLDATGSQITSKVGIGPLDSGGFGLQVSLDVHAPNIPADDARELMLRADQRCRHRTRPAETSSDHLEVSRVSRRFTRSHRAGIRR